MLNINIGHNKALFDKCRMLWEYSMFVDLTRKNIKESKDPLVGIRKAIDECVKRNILKEFLIEKQSEVIAMCLFSFDKEKYEKTIKNEGITEGEKKGELNTIYNFIKKGRMTLEEASSDVGISVEDLLAGFKEYNLIL